MNTTEAAMNRWNGILQNFGIDQVYLSDKHGPCPICGEKDRFRFDDKGGRGTWFCNSCGAGNGFDLAMRITGLEFKEVAREIDKFVGMIPESESKRPRNDPSILLKRISQNLERPTRHDPVGKYLERRGVEIPEFGVFTVHASHISRRANLPQIIRQWSASSAMRQKTCYIPHHLPHRVRRKGQGRNGQKVYAAARANGGRSDHVR